MLINYTHKMNIYRYQTEESFTGLVHAKTNWHTTIEGATKELLSRYPKYTNEQMEEDLVTQKLILEDQSNEQ